MQLVLRAPRLGDAEGLARAAQDLAARHTEVEPERFHVPEFEQTVGWLRGAIHEPPRRRARLVAEPDGDAVGDAKALLHETMSKLTSNRNSTGAKRLRATGCRP